MKPTNVFLTSPEGGRLKIGGFGSAAAAGHDIACKAELSVYLSPEVMQHEAYGPGVDVWGAGSIAAESLALQYAVFTLVCTDLIIHGNPDLICLAPGALVGRGFRVTDTCLHFLQV